MIHKGTSAECRQTEYVASDGYTLIMTFVSSHVWTQRKSHQKPEHQKQKKGTTAKNKS